MRIAQVTYPGTDLNYSKASRLAESLVREDDEFFEPVLIAAYDRKICKASPGIEGTDHPASSPVYAANLDGQLEIDIAGEYVFIYADACTPDD